MLFYLYSFSFNILEQPTENLSRFGDSQNFEHATIYKPLVK